MATKPAAPKKEEETQPQPVAAWPKFLRSNTSFPYTDPVTNLRFTPTTPVRVDVEPAEGSWLRSQMDAGYIGEA